MRHRVGGFKLKRDISARRALLRNLVTSVVMDERIETTIPKAKAAKPLVEKMITLAKEGTLHSRRQAASFADSRERQEAFRQAGAPLRPTQRRLHPHRPRRLSPG